MHAMLIEETQELGLLRFLQLIKQFMKGARFVILTNDNERVLQCIRYIFVLKHVSH